MIPSHQGKEPHQPHLVYVEPVLLVAVALLLGDSLAEGQWLTYGPIWLAVVVLIIEGLKHVSRQRRSI